MSLKINALFPLVFFTFLRIYSFSPANEISLSLHNPLLKTKNKLVMTSITVGCLLAFFICYKICKHQNNDTLKISEKPMQPELTLPTNVESKGSFAQLISPQMIGCFILYTLLLKQPLLFSKMTNTTLPFLYQKMQGLPETQLTKMYEQLCLNRQNFFGDQIGRFSLPNSIETIPSTNYFGKVDMVQKQIAQDALTTHAIVHQKIITLITDFIAYKSQYSEHKDFFRHYLNKEYEYVNRLLTKRPMFFYGSTDFHAFPFGSLAVTNDGIAGFIENKMSYDAIKNYISYDEMPISALVGLCSPTYCINNGNRYNNGVFAPQIPRALYCGLVGTRFERPGYMEWQHIIIDPEQNTEANGYGQKNTEKNNDKKKLLDVWAAFYGIDHFPTYDEVVTYTDKNEHQTSYIPLYNSSDLSRPIFFHATVYKQRMRFVIEPFLSNANEYGKLEKKEIYTHAVGLGSGAWGAIRKNGLLYHPKLYSNTTKDMLNSLQLECYAECLQHNLMEWQHITDIDFSYWGNNVSIPKVMDIFQKNPSFKNNLRQPTGGLFTRFLNIFFNYWSPDFFTLSMGSKQNMNIHISYRHPFATLSKQDRDKIIVSMYAWDSNSFPGNEYYAGSKSESGDPAAACCSTIADLQNPFINRWGLTNIIVYPSKNVLT